MGRSVTLRTPIPTLDQVGERLGISKTRQRSLIGLAQIAQQRFFVAPPRCSLARDNSTTGASTSTATGSFRKYLDFLNEEHEIERHVRHPRFCVAEEANRRGLKADAKKSSKVQLTTTRQG